MKLLDIRLKLRELSGRFDLVNEDGADNGADFFINEAQRFLDRMDETSKSWASCFRFIDVGKFAAQIPYCRAIKEVWAASSTERWQLKKINFQDMLSDYLTEMPSQRDTGVPLYYSPVITRYIPENETADNFESFAGWVDIPAGNASEYNSIVINVPTSEKIVVEVKGLFYSMKLVDDDDENHWTINHPLLLIMATQMQLEIVNRNTQGVNDWMNAISPYMRQLGMDLVEELIAEVDQMEG